MSSAKCLRNNVSFGIIVAFAAAILFAAPAVLQPQTASAQGVTCGGVFYASGTYCGNTGGGGVTCSDGVYYPGTTSCPSSVGVTCGGASYPSGTSCGNTGTPDPASTTVYPANQPSGATAATNQSCPDGTVVPITQSC